MKSLESLASKQVLNNYLRELERLPPSMANGAIKNVFDQIDLKSYKKQIVRTTLTEYSEILKSIKAVIDENEWGGGLAVNGEKDYIDAVSQQIIRLEMIDYTKKYSTRNAMMITINPFFIELSPVYKFEGNAPWIPETEKSKRTHTSLPIVIPIEKHLIVMNLLAKYQNDLANTEFKRQLELLMEVETVNTNIHPKIDIVSLFEGKLIPYLIKPLYWLATNSIREQIYYDLTQKERRILNDFRTQTLKKDIVLYQRELYYIYFNSAINRIYTSEYGSVVIKCDLNKQSITVEKYLVLPGEPQTYIFKLDQYRKAIKLMENLG